MASELVLFTFWYHPENKEPYLRSLTCRKCHLTASMLRALKKLKEEDSLDDSDVASLLECAKFSYHYSVQNFPVTGSTWDNPYSTTFRRYSSPERWFSLSPGEYISQFVYMNVPAALS